MSSDKSMFESGWLPPVQQQAPPGQQKGKLDPQPAIEHVPDGKGGSKLYQPAGKLKGKKAIITGGDSGIGQSTATLFAMEGADVLITYLPEEEVDAKETKSLVEKHGGKCYTLAVDLRDMKNCQKVIDEAMSKMGAINILFNNHAYQMMIEDIHDLSEEQWIKTFDTNIHPFFYLSKYALAHTSAGDTIINDASINAYIGRPDLLDYTCTKGAIVSLTRGLANQFAAKGIRCNQVAPGPVWTPLVASTMTPEALKQFTTPMGRPAQPSEIATCVVFLASTDSSMLTGETIHCNGGGFVTS
ncbi:hypothetical protein LTR91_002101 [Friedmanniomyces endolithicus]|uniref:Uncharacterized protein n=1 Tax=Friedmanniomyces endolithicus TaxID=329885 RepID=A0AAN6L162_9PEZI|nr:hypothetical protein LTR91_002101 [Friedmanniomyces endolithicus]